MIVAHGLALTSAHVVAGAEEITVDQRGRRRPGTIVGFDPEIDLAYVAFDALPTRIPEIGSDHVTPGDTGVAYVVRDHEVTEVPVRVRRRVKIRTEDIYIDVDTLRPGIELDAEIQSGDSAAR